ncbi:MAG: GNAT family N-acetyltransferase [Chloroflexota bacterium]|nr:GNAT family N-acetyltransferase [Chloroflexota bacterium]
MSSGEAAPRVTPFHVGALTAPAAAAIAGWRYPPPYDFYNPFPDIAAYLIDPANAYFAAYGLHDELAGFFCYGAEAQVFGGHVAGLYSGDATLDLGLGMHPDLMGHGSGAPFVAAGLAFGRARYRPRAFRLTVACFNTRAIRVYTQAGFVPGPVFPSPTARGEVPFLLMQRAEPLP